MDKVMIVVGAGASKDVANTSAPVKNQWTPPLASELFGKRASDHFWEILRRYPGAVVLSSELAPLADSNTLPLEQKLRDYSQHKDPRVRQHFRQIPPYLRDLLAMVSASYTSNPAGYIQLVKGLIADHPHEVLFVSLNYDTMLEQALYSFDHSFEFNSYEHYIERSRKCTVVKPHGSSDWMSRLGPTHRAGWNEWVENIDLDRIDRYWAMERTTAPISEIIIDDQHVYPTITAPLADKMVTELNCPSSHTEHLRQFAAECEKYLIIGTSGLDGDVLEILKTSVSEVESIEYVGLADTELTRSRFEEVIPQFRNPPRLPKLHTDGFQAYVGSESFQTFLSS